MAFPQQFVFHQVVVWPNRLWYRYFFHVFPIIPKFLIKEVKLTFFATWKMKLTKETRNSGGERVDSRPHYEIKVIKLVDNRCDTSLPPPHLSPLPGPAAPAFFSVVTTPFISVILFSSITCSILQSQLRSRISLQNRYCFLLNMLISLLFCSACTSRLVA